LSAHRNEEFYSKLENLKLEEMKNPLIDYVFKINDAIEEGNYRRVFHLKK
jgi:26S proteasome regulatory subunit N12